MSDVAFPLSPHRHRRPDRRRQDDAGAPARRAHRRRPDARAAGRKPLPRPLLRRHAGLRLPDPALLPLPAAKADAGAGAAEHVRAHRRQRFHVREGRALRQADAERRRVPALHADACRHRRAAARARPRGLAAGRAGDLARPRAASRRADGAGDAASATCSASARPMPSSSKATTKRRCSSSIPSSSTRPIATPIWSVWSAASKASRAAANSSAPRSMSRSTDFPATMEKSR